MIDPDAPSSEQPITGPFIHWILSNLKENNGTDGQTICEFRSNFVQDLNQDRAISKKL